MSYLKNCFEKSTAKSISDKVCDAMRASIINKYLDSGERLVEAKLAKELTVSITPVRHAFAQLAKEGLIDVFPFKGTYVKILTKKFINEVSNVRIALEMQAAEQAFDNITSNDIRQLTEYANILEHSFDIQTSLYEISKTDTLFHDIIFERSNNELLIELWNLIKPRMQFITSYNKLNIPGVVRKERHLLLIEDIKSHNKVKFLDDMRLHCIKLEADFPISHTSADSVPF